ncbi:hypothetical protein BaRGS_00009395 [Batillaria attramentaria]|uniref:Essential protein Yae1 N-terminal domain-containing protein n=1 Tax=Batillaria attramentaria TaxID=370345 RepID=A0ABD0LIZ3_9CAEN
MAYWAPSAQTDMDDVFDDEAEDELVVRKEWNRAENDIRKTGYRLGLSAGEEETLQQGFDAGYKEASRVAFAVGRLQGMISKKLMNTCMTQFAPSQFELEAGVIETGRQKTHMPWTDPPTFPHPVQTLRSQVIRTGIHMREGMKGRGGEGSHGISR